MVRVMRASMIVMPIIFLMVLILSSQQYQMAHAQMTVPLESKARAYVTNVLPFNMSHYTVMVNSAYSLPSGPNDPTITQAVDIDLKSSDNSIHVVCVYVNGTLDQCGVRPTGTPVSDKSYASVKDVAARVLQAHQEQTGFDSTVFLKTLSLVNGTESMNVALDNVNLSLSKFPDIAGLKTVDGMPVPISSNSSFSVNFHWTDTQNGITRSLISLSFDNGVFYDLQDARPTNPPSNTISNIIEQQSATPTPTPIATAQQENSASLSITSQPTNGTSPQTNQLPSKSLQVTTDSQNELIIPLLIAAVAAYVIVVIAVLTYKSKKEI
jgi:hypothetical protein